MDTFSALLTTGFVVLMVAICIGGLLIRTNESDYHLYIDDEDHHLDDDGNEEMVGTMEDLCPGCGATYSEQDYHYQICQKCGLINGSTAIKDKGEFT